uniref:Uncharacterized protein n=1 Tax=viral metagenome TaxID=1070528 RepID=A0A6C0AEI2_9ZZZZ
MGFTFSKNVPSDYFFEECMTLFEDCNFDNFVFEKYIDIFLCLIKHDPLSLFEKKYKYVLTKGVLGLGYKLYVQKVNESSVLVSSYNKGSREEVCAKFFVSNNIDLNSKVHISKFMSILKKKRIFIKEKTSDIFLEDDISIDIFSKKVTEIENGNMTNIGKKIEIESIKSQQVFVKKIQTLNKLEKCFSKLIIVL